MVNINLSLTPAIEAYLNALIYRNTRISCLSLAELGSFVSHDSLNRLLHSTFPWSRLLWELFSSRMIHQGGYFLLDDTTCQRQASGYLKQVTAEVRIMKDGKRYWATNDLSLSPVRIKRQYRNRQQIEGTFRFWHADFLIIRISRKPVAQ